MIKLCLETIFKKQFLSLKQKKNYFLSFYTVIANFLIENKFIFQIKNLIKNENNNEKYHIFIYIF